MNSSAEILVVKPPVGNYFRDYVISIQTEDVVNVKFNFKRGKLKIKFSFADDSSVDSPVTVNVTITPDEDNQL